MRALQYRTYGGPEVLAWAEAPDPHPGPGQVRIAVRAASVNPIDWKGFSGAMSGGEPMAGTGYLGSDAAGWPAIQHFAGYHHSRHAPASGIAPSTRQLDVGATAPGPLDSLLTWMPPRQRTDRWAGAYSWRAPAWARPRGRHLAVVVARRER